MIPGSQAPCLIPGFFFEAIKKPCPKARLKLVRLVIAIVLIYGAFSSDGQALPLA